MSMWMERRNFHVRRKLQKEPKGMLGPGWSEFLIL